MVTCETRSDPNNSNPFLLLRWARNYGMHGVLGQLDRGKHVPLKSIKKQQKCQGHGQVCVTKGPVLPRLSRADGGHCPRSCLCRRAGADGQISYFPGWATGVNTMTVLQRHKGLVKKRGKCRREKGRTRMTPRHLAPAERQPQGTGPRQVCIF